MIVLKLNCGLGNQLFQYAFARAMLQKLNEKRIYLDLSGFDNEPDGRHFVLSNFVLPKDTQTLGKVKSAYYSQRSKLIKRYVRHCVADDNYGLNMALARYGIYNWNFEFCSEIHKGCIHYIDGIFQNRNYFTDVDREIKNIYQSYRMKNQKAQLLLNEINKSESVCVHIRLGDYRTNKRWRDELLVCTEQYYSNGINYIKSRKKDARFYCFSNTHEDIEWIKDNYHLPSDVFYVDMNNSDIDDFTLMCSCKNFIISNSSFSWWAQYLGNSTDKIVVAPTYWDTGKEKYEGIYLDSWILISPN